MKASLLFSATLFSLSTLAFPASLFNDDMSDATLAEITALAAKITKELETKKDGNERRGLGFNADAQRISNTGKHAYIAPGPNDLRGPCPGLNVLANHGYISRDGVASVVQIATASNEVFGMGLDLSTALSVYSGVAAGDVTSVSIGGKPKDGGLTGIGSSLGLLGEPQGLSASHNRFEADASPTRADEYVGGDSVNFKTAQFEELLAMPLGPNGIDLSVLVPFRVARVHNSISTNGHFFAGPLTHNVINAATYFFTYRYFANHTAEQPEGYLDEETLKSFEGVTGSKGSFQWASGRERIPDNWYRRAIGDDYGIASFVLDAAPPILQYPDLVRVGGNTGEPNSFVGVDLDNLTGGVFNAANLLEGNNAVCFGFMAASEVAPDLLRGLVGNVLAAVGKLTDALDPIFRTLGCPQLVKYDKLLLSKFPGAGDGL